jgi:hypothetical protein
VSEFTHDISIVATVEGLDPIELYATQTIADVEHFSRGVIDDANPEIPGTTGGVAGNRPDFLLVIAKGDSVQVELDNGDDMDVSLLKGQTFGMLSGKTFTRTTDAGDTAVSADAVGLNTVVGGRGSMFEYLAVTKEVPDPCESNTSLSFIVPDGSSNTFQGATTSGYFAVFDSVVGLFEVVESGQQASMSGTICIVPSDIDGNPSGQWTGLGILFADPFDNSVVMDLSNLDGVTLSEEVDSGASSPSSLYFIDGGERMSIEIPNLAGSNESLVIDNCSDLEDVIIPSGVKFKKITVSACQNITEASVDALCNALDATATGQASSFVGTAVATAASLANRLAYLVNNTLTFTP